MSIIFTLLLISCSSLKPGEPPPLTLLEQAEQAILVDNSEQLETLLDKAGLSVYSVLQGGLNLFDFAIKHKAQKSAILLLERGMYPSMTDLDKAYQQGLYDLVEAMVGKGASLSVDFMNNVVKDGHTELFQWLSDHHSFDSSRYTLDHYLKTASNAGCSGIINILLKKGASPKGVDLVAMYKNGHVDAVKNLISGGFSTHGFDVIAIQEGNQAFLEFLRQQPGYKSTVIDDAFFDRQMDSNYLQFDRKNKILEGLIDGQLEFKLTDDKFYQELKHAVDSKGSAYFKTLLRLPNKLSSERLGDLLPDDVFDVDSENIVLVLVEHGAKVGSQKIINYYSSKGRDFAERVIGYGTSNLKGEDWYGKTILFHAVASVDENFVRFLFKHGISSIVNKTDLAGNTPLDMRVDELKVQRPSHDGILELLCANGARTSTKATVYSCQAGWSTGRSSGGGPGSETKTKLAECRKLYEEVAEGKTLTQNMIKSLYRKLVRKYHPDLCGQTENCRDMMKKTNECKEVLQTSL